jgi:ubiquinone/menaquinone biosynthesis C-methylase UbiE
MSTDVSTAAGQIPSFENYSGTAPENYERYFVPAIGAPLAAELIDVAALRPGERVLDVACGTGIVTRLAAERVGADGAVAGVDINRGMLGVARSTARPELGIVWYEVGAEALAFQDASFDVALCQMGLQFFPDKLAALRQVRRVLVPGGRLVLNVPGPTPRIFGTLADELARHVKPEAAGFVHQVFSLHEVQQLESLVSDAGFVDVSIRASDKRLHLGAPEEFLWQYVRSTPLAAAVAELDVGRRATFAREIVAQWEPFAEHDALILSLRVVMAFGRAG